MRYSVGRLVALAALLAAWLGAAGAHAKPSATKRSVADVEFAIHATHPSLAPAKRHRLAETLVRVAREQDFDALTGWAIIEHESHWQDDAVGRDGQDVGLAQIRYTSDPACRDRDSEACNARREALFEPAINIEAMGRALSAWRELCTEMTGRAPNTAQILAGYGGYSRPSKKIYCNRQRRHSKRGWHWEDLPTPKGVAEVVALYDTMLARLRSERPTRPTAKAGAKASPKEAAKASPKADASAKDDAKASPTGSKKAGTKPSKKAGAKPSKKAGAKPSKKAGGKSSRPRHS